MQLEYEFNFRHFYFVSFIFLLYYLIYRALIRYFN